MLLLCCLLDRATDNTGSESAVVGKRVGPSQASDLLWSTVEILENTDIALRYREGRGRTLNLRSFFAFFPVFEILLYEHPVWPAPAAPAAEGCHDLLGCFYLSSDVGRQGSGLSIAGCVC